MLFLKVMEIALIVILGYLLLSQIILPAAFSTKLFPMFKPSALKNKVIDLKEEVSDMEQMAKNLAALKILNEQKAKLEAEIAAQSAPSVQTQTKE